MRLILAVGPREFRTLRADVRVAIETGLRVLMRDQTRDIDLVIQSASDIGVTV